jgi:hypothetical protein
MLGSIRTSGKSMLALASLATATAAIANRQLRIHRFQELLNMPVIEKIIARGDQSLSDGIMSKVLCHCKLFQRDADVAR